MKNKNESVKIEKLTSEQEAKFKFYVDKYVDTGLTTKKRTLEDAIIDFSMFQSKVLKESVKPIILLDSPVECWVAVCQLNGLNNSNGGYDTALWNRVKNTISNQLKQQDVILIIKDVDGNASELKFVWPYFDCQFWSGWLSFFEFMKTEVGIQYDVNTEYEAFKSCAGYGMVFPVELACVVCQPFSEIHRNKSGLHNERGVALSYNGMNEIYALNGVTMKKEYVMTPANEITAETVMKETNVEVRRELIKKVGIERLFNDLPHKLLDKRDNYELYSIDLSDEVKDARYLKMVNPSIGCFHLEGVAPDIMTVKDALLWRNQNLFVDAEILT
jgi:hypothetical protein